MIQASQRNRRHLAAVFQSRFGSGAKRLKAAVAEGRFGRLSLCSCYIKWWRGQDYYDQGGWRGTKSWDGGGALFNQGIHTIDLLQWIAGMPVEVSARVAVLAHERIEVEDTAVALLRYGNGALGVIEAATSTWPGVSSRIEISGSGGSAILENGKIILWKFSDELFADLGNLPEVDLPGSGSSDPKLIGVEGHCLQIADLANAIRTERPPAIDGAEGRHGVQLIRAIYEAAKAGHSIPVSR